MRNLPQPRFALSIAGLLSSPLAAQQFQYAPEALPGSNDRWTEGVDAADVDRDGDMDLFFAEGAGTSSAGTPEQNRLVMNQLWPPPSEFVDESVTRLGVHSSIAKLVITGDVQNDGWIDALFCNLGAPPSLYVNRGAIQPGVFDFAGAARGFTESLDSYGGQFGDLDEDGDLDAILSDHGDTLFGPGGKPRLYMNDGLGHFTETPAALPAPVKSAQMDVQLVDVDGDWDLDFFGPTLDPGAEPRHYLFLNDGLGNFTDASALIPATTVNVREVEVADLDGDTDTDFFFLGLGPAPAGLGEGVVANQLVPSGVLAFRAGPSALTGTDSEVALIDHDFDGDLDVLIASIDGPSNTLLVNQGALGFAVAVGALSPISDPTLDGTFADMNLDGAYDLITACGEAGHPADWRNKIYYNNGATDLIAPDILRTRALSDGQPKAGPWTVLAEVRDQIVDDGVPGITAQAVYDVDGVGTTAPGTYMGGGLFRFELGDTTGGLGTAVNYALVFADSSGNQGSTGFLHASLCGAARYAEEAAGANTVALDGGGGVFPGGQVTLTSTGLSGPGALHLISLGNLSAPFLGGTLLADPAKLVALPVSPAVGGEAVLELPLPADPVLTGLSFFVQSLTTDAGHPQGFALSNGLAVRLCDTPR